MPRRKQARQGRTSSITQCFRFQLAQAAFLQINLHVRVARGQQRDETAQIGFMADEQDIFWLRAQVIQLLNEQFGMASRG